MSRGRPRGWSPCAATLLLAGLAWLPAASIAQGAAPPPAAGLKDAATAHGLRIGTSVVGMVGPYLETALREFNLITPENAMKWGVLRPEAGVYDFRWADQMVRMAQSNGMKVRGESPVWYQQLPPWLENGAFSRDQMITILHDHIATVMGHYRNVFPGVVYQWDVVNEAIEECPGPQRCNFRNDIWLQRIGPDYIELAFRFAHEADPTAQLYYNEFGIEGDDQASAAKRDGLMHLLTWLHNDGVPINGVGLQFHTSIDGPKDATIADLMNRIAAFGYDVAVTELDVGAKPPLPPAKPGQPPPAPQPPSFSRQAATYGRILDACLRQPRCHTFVMWGFSDAVSWRAAEQPCIFDGNYRSKPAYYALRDGLLGRRPQ